MDEINARLNRLEATRPKATQPPPEPHPSGMSETERLQDHLDVMHPYCVEIMWHVLDDLNEIYMVCSCQGACNRLSIV